jgi:hypothetical protein
MSEEMLDTRRVRRCKTPKHTHTAQQHCGQRQQ